MSQNPLANLRRRQPRERATFPDERYRRLALDPAADRALGLFAEAAREVYRAQAVVLGEQRIVDPPVVAAILDAVARAEPSPDALPQHPLSALEQAIVAASSPALLQGSAPEEVLLASGRLALRERVLRLSDALLALREALQALATAHLTTLVLATANGQVVQPTTLGHYLAGQLPPLARASERLRESFERVNVSPLGAVSGTGTAMPLRPGRLAELLGFDRAAESTFDALAAADALVEPALVVAMLAGELNRFVADLQFWARDDVGLLTPGEGFIHAPGAQPQRRDPVVLDWLRAQLAALLVAPTALLTLGGQRAMLGGQASLLALLDGVLTTLDDATTVVEVLAAVVAGSQVNRALFAHRSHRGFATASELADLLTVDFRLPRDEAYRLTEQVVIEWSEQGGEATNLTPDIIDRVALRVVGREIGIEPELLAKCLAPKRVIERRSGTGGPAPSAVSAALDRETFSARRDRGWLDDTHARLAAARDALHRRADEIVAEPEAVLRRPESRDAAE